MIHLNEIVKCYGSTEVLRGVTLAVASGEVCVLLGPSGGGKSTLLRTINGLETFTSGTIQIGSLKLGPEQNRQREATLLQIRQRVGMVFQQFHLFPHLSVLEPNMQTILWSFHLYQTQTPNPKNLCHS